MFKHEKIWPKQYFLDGNVIRHEQNFIMMENHFSAPIPERNFFRLVEGRSFSGGGNECRNLHFFLLISEASLNRVLAIVINL